MPTVMNMKESTQRQITASVQDFSLPRYNDIPSMGLYLEQTTKYISECLAPVLDSAITTSMISNYVKKGLISNPVKKQYSRDQIAKLLFIALAKSVISLDNLYKFMRLQEKTYPTEKAYNYMRMEFENLVQYVFGIKDTIDNVGIESSHEKAMLRNTIITVAHKIYLDKCFEAMSAELDDES